MNSFIFDNFQENHYKKWEEYTQAATSQLSPMTPEEFWIKENLDKKDRVYGFDIERVKLKKSCTIAAARHSSDEHFDPKEQAQLLNHNISKQAKPISQIAKKQGKTERSMKKVLRFLKGQNDEQDSPNDNDDPMNLSHSD